MILQYTDYQVELKLTPALKSIIKSLVAIAFKMKKEKATTTNIKATFPNWDLRKTTSWYGIMAECLEKIDREEKPVWQLIKEKIQELGLIPGKCDSLCGYSYQVSWLSREGYKSVGSLGYSNIHQAYYYGGRSRNFYFNNIEDAAKYMISHSGVKVSVAA
jgi:hypothetical protein